MLITNLLYKIVFSYGSIKSYGVYSSLTGFIIEFFIFIFSL